MKIKEVLLENDEKLIFYLSNIGIDSVSQISMDVINNLKFVPGINQSNINQLLELLENVGDTNSINNLSQEKHIIIDKKRQSVISEGRIRISDLIQNIPRSHTYITRLMNERIEFLDEIGFPSVEDIMQTKGIGIDTAKRILDAIVSQNITQSDSSRRIESDIKYYYGKLLCVSGGIDFVKYCKKKNLATIQDLISLDFFNAKINKITKEDVNKIFRQFLDTLSAEASEVVEFHVKSEVDRIFLQEFCMHTKTWTPEEMCAKLSDYKLTNSINNSADLEYSKLLQSFALLKYSEKLSLNRAVRSLSAGELTILRKRARGFTLESIGTEIGVTRERVRQIAAKTILNLTEKAHDSVRMMTDSNCSFHLDAIRTDEVLSEVSKEILDYVLRMTKNKDYIYFRFAEKFIAVHSLPENYENILLGLPEKLIGGIASIDNLVNRVGDSLEEWGFPSLNFEDFMNYCLSNGYKVSGDLLFKRSLSYALICVEVIKEEFKFDIKLDSEESNGDLLHLRRVMSKLYDEVIIPDNNRALSARLMPYMVLTNRGRYAPVSKVKFDYDTITDIFRGIMISEKETFHFVELFEKNRQNLNYFSSISNRYYLQGIMKLMYSEEFLFDKDSLTKKGAMKESLGDKIEKIVLVNGGPITHESLLAKVAGQRDYIISQIVERNPHIISWGIGTIIHVGNLDLTDARLQLRPIIVELLANGSGYTSEYLVYEEVSKKDFLFMKTSHINSASKLYYVCKYLFENEFQIGRKPHIVSKKITMDLRSDVILKKFVIKEDSFSYRELVAFGQKHKWSGATINSAVEKVCKNYIRVSEDEYTSLDFSKFGLVINSAVMNEIEKLLSPTGYYVIDDIFNYDNFPDINLEWNSFLLKSIIEFFYPRVKTVAPRALDRRYVRDIIVSIDSVNTYEDLVIYLLSVDGRNNLSEADFRDFLQSKAIIRENIPIELYGGDLLSYRGEKFRY